MPRSLGLAHLSAIDLTPHELIDLAYETGCASVALRLHSAAPGTPVYPIGPGSAALSALRHHAESRKVAISEVELVPITEELEIAELGPLMEVASALGATGIIVTGDIEDDAVLLERFRGLCELAQAHGLLVHLEFMRWRAVGMLEAATRLVRMSGRPNARVLIDLLHLVRSGGSAADLTALPPDMVSLVQICDARAELEGDIIAEARTGRLMPYSGALPIDALLAALGPGARWAIELPGLGQGAVRRQALARTTDLLRASAVRVFA
jgi:sugar phosphate isomerase/epimerase